MNYGMPYKGSKNKIAKDIINLLPSATHFYDLFGGGGAISHCALLSGKYKYVHYNELNPLVYNGFKMTVNGEFKDERRWISREDFIRLKNTDPYVAICFSFINDLNTYMYSKEIEPLKREQHIKGVLTSRLVHFERLHRLQELEGLNIELSNMSYSDVKIEKDSVIYCDPPYEGTRIEQYINYKSFDFQKFYEFAIKNDCFVSEVSNKPNFKIVWRKEIYSKVSGTHNTKRTELLLLPKETKRLNPLEW